MGLVEIIDSPNQPALDVAPSSEIFYVEISHCKNLGSFGQVGTYFRPNLDPAIESRAQKHEHVLVHAPVLQAEVGFHDLGVPAQPLFIARGGFSDVHGLPR